MAKNNHLTPTPAKEWRRAREEGYPIRLLSGNVVRLRPVALDVLIMSGDLPDVLTPYAAKTLWAEVDTGDIGNEAEMAKGFAELVNHVCKASFLEPRIVDDEASLEEDGILLEDVSFNDKIQVFQIATQPAEAVRKFRERQEESVEPVLDGESNGAEAE